MSPLDLLRQQRAYQRIAIGMSRASAVIQLRTPDPQRALSWVFCGFSQNGEDGIIDYLTQRLREPNRYFVEIGSSNGLENLTTWLALGRRFSGIMVEGNSKLVRTACLLFPSLNHGVRFRHQFVTAENVGSITSDSRYSDPDFFALDIDGNDYHVVRQVLDSGFRPKVVALEYNSAFGPERAVTVPYQQDFDIRRAHPSGMYFGASIAAWRLMLPRYGYEFVTVDSNGVNAFFGRPECFGENFLGRVTGLDFADNYAHCAKFGGDWKVHSKILGDLPLIDIA
jgi:hypothetical protein